jgi:hypothetical protein
MALCRPFVLAAPEGFCPPNPRPAGFSSFI